MSEFLSASDLVAFHKGRRRLNREAKIAQMIADGDYVIKEPQPAPTPVVYFVQGEATGLIKIGHSYDFAQRWKSLVTMSPDALKVLATVPGTTADERAFHARFSDARRHGEWFHPSPEILQYLSKVDCA